MIHKFKLGGFNALLDVNSGGVHIIDDLTYDLLDNVEPPFEEKCPEDVVRKLSKMYDSKDIEDCYEEIVSLYNDKILFSEDFCFIKVLRELIEVAEKLSSVTP